MLSYVGEGRGTEVFKNTCFPPESSSFNTMSLFGQGTGLRSGLASESQLLITTPLSHAGTWAQE